MERQAGVPSGVSWQVSGEHRGNKVLGPEGTMSVDNRDSRRRDQSENPHELTCKELVHFTENKFAAEIGGSYTVPSFSFKAFPWGTNTLNLTWWSPLPPDNWKDSLKRNDFYDFNCIGNSAALNGSSICGPIGFAVSWKDILEQYANGRRNEAKIELRNLGTYLYKREIMFAVLVCMESDFKDNRFPVITFDDGTEAFRGSPYSDDFTWKVYSTISHSAGRTLNGHPRTWDHLTFGFYCPTPNLNIPAQCCRIIGKTADKYRPRSRSDSSMRNELERQFCKDTVTKLEEKISMAKSALNIPST
ncbi:hypothetical protein HA402_004390 [Bradysia odoriphaga]|nr:hypothetical protein HA402_004390 [Bradysia odoriphaga]